MQLDSNSVFMFQVNETEKAEETHTQESTREQLTHTNEQSESERKESSPIAPAATNYNESKEKVGKSLIPAGKSERVNLDSQNLPNKQMNPISKDGEHNSNPLFPNQLSEEKAVNM